MSQDNPKPKVPHWRDPVGDKQAAAPGQRGWRQGEAAAVRQPNQPMSRFTKLLVAGTLLSLALAGIVVVIWWFRPPKPASVLLVGSGYETNLLLPPNALGWNGLKRIEEWAENANRSAGSAESSWW